MKIDAAASSMDFAAASRGPSRWNGRLRVSPLGPASELMYWMASSSKIAGIRLLAEGIDQSGLCPRTIVVVAGENILLHDWVP